MTNLRLLQIPCVINLNFLSAATISGLAIRRILRIVGRRGRASVRPSAEGEVLKDDGVLGSLALLQVEALDHTVVLHPHVLDSFFWHSLVFCLNC